MAGCIAGGVLMVRVYRVCIYSGCGCVFLSVVVWVGVFYYVWWVFLCGCVWWCVFIVYYHQKKTCVFVLV